MGIAGGNKQTQEASASGLSKRLLKEFTEVSTKHAPRWMSKPTPQTRSPKPQTQKEQGKKGIQREREKRDTERS